MVVSVVEADLGTGSSLDFTLEGSSLDPGRSWAPWALYGVFIEQFGELFLALSGVWESGHRGRRTAVSFQAVTVLELLCCHSRHFLASFLTLCVPVFI